MIVNYLPQGWEIITQRAHGCLAAQIAHQWKHNIRTERWIETLLAIAEHDDAQTELEQENLLTDKGGPVDFKMRDINYDHCIRTLNFSRSKSRYHSLMSSMHLDFLLKDNVDETIEPIIKEQNEHRKILRKQLNLTIIEAERDYALMEWCDALSLLLCQEQNQAQLRPVQISCGPDHKNQELIQLDDNIFTVKSWPFEAPNFNVFYETRLLSKLSFEDDNDFKTDLSIAPVIEKALKFIRS